MQGNPYGYRNMNWNGYQIQRYPIQPQFIEQYALGIFQYFDRNRSGTLDMSEVPPMINQLFTYLQLPMPNVNDVYYTMNMHDYNRDGQMSFVEFRKMLYFMAGYPNA